MEQIISVKVIDGGSIFISAVFGF